MAVTVRRSYWQAVSIYLRDHVLKRFGQQSLDIVISGGASHVLHQQLTEHFASLGLNDQVIFADGVQTQLPAVVSEMPELALVPSLLLRMVDCYGLFQGLAGKLSKVTA